MQYPVLQRVERRRRRRRRRGPLLLVIVAAVLTAASLAFATGWPHARSHPHHHARPHFALSATPRPAHRRLGPLLVSSPGQPQHVFRPPLLASAAVLVDTRQGRVVYAKRPHQQLPVASTTKIMTATIALERLGLQRKVLVDPLVTRVALLREGLRGREHVPVWKLLDGLLVFSGNDDALALAIATAGSRGAFVALMNAKARELGLRETQFSSPSGVVDLGNHSSAFDLAALGRYAMRDPRFRAIVRQQIVRVRWAAPTFSRVYVNKNQLLGRYLGADGIKTGWTTLAGHCLVASAHRGEVRLIAVVLHSPDPYRDVQRLLNFGFTQVH